MLCSAMQAFPPDSSIEHFVECFLRTEAPRPMGYLRLLYRSVRRGPIREVPRDGVVNLLLTLDCSVDEPQAPTAHSSLCHAMLCHAMPCHAMLRSSSHSSSTRATSLPPSSRHSAQHSIV